jgi:putative heme degradation protein
MDCNKLLALNRQNDEVIKEQKSTFTEKKNNEILHLVIRAKSDVRGYRSIYA